MEFETTYDTECQEADRSSSSSEWMRGLREAVPVMLGFVPFALVLGAQATRKGFATTEVPLMTGLNFGGGSEFAAIQLWTSPPHVLLIVAITFLVNSRHLLMGAALTPFLKGLSKRKACMALFFMCDESWAMGLADTKRREATTLSLPYYMGAALALYGTWVCATYLGALLGPVMGNPETYGFDMAFPAVFLILLKGMWTGLRAAIPWLVSLAVGVLACVLLPGAWYVVVGSAAGILCACCFQGGRS